MAPFFKSSLFNISRRRRKEQKSLDTCIPSPLMLRSRSLPNLEELRGISARLEEFHPILQRQVVCASSPLNEDSASLERISPIPTLVSSEAILCSESDFADVQDEYGSPKLDEHSTPGPTPFSTSEPVSPPENSSIGLDGESTPRVADCSILESVLSESHSIEQTLCEPEPSFVPSSKSSGELDSQAGDLKPLKPILSTNCGLSVVSAITGLNPSKSTRASQPKTAKTAFIREDESAEFLKQLDDFAVFFGVEKPSKIISTPTLEIQAKLGCNSETDMSSLTAIDCHKDDTPSCGHREMVESFKAAMDFLYQIQASLEKSYARARDENLELLEEREILTENFNQLQKDFDAERTKNAKLESMLHTMKFDHISILTRQDWEMNQLKRFNAAMVDLQLHSPVLFNASRSVCNGQPADAALIAAIKEAATKFGSPWARILPAITEDRIQRCDELEGDLRRATKKYLFWKMKAQMDPRHAKFVTPSSSSMSLVLDACLPKETLELNGINNLLAKIKTGNVPRRSQPPASSPVIAGSARFEGATVASAEPSEDVPSKAPIASSPILIPEESSGDVPLETPVASLPILIPEEPSEDLLYDTPVALSPIPISEELNEDKRHEAPVSSSAIPIAEELSEDEPYEAPVSSSLLIIPEEANEDAPSESVASPQMESSPALSGRSSFTCEAPARVIRHYIPGRALFGKDGSGLAPPGLFDRDEHEDSSESPALSHGNSPYPGLTGSVSLSMVRNYVVDQIEYVSYSQESLGLEYIDEFPVDGRANPILRDDSDDALVSGNHVEMLVPEPTTSTSEITAVSETLKDDVEIIKVPKSASKSSFSSLRRLSVSSSKLKQSISSGLARLRQISFTSNKAERAEKPAPATSRPRAMTFQTHRRMQSTFGKENRPKHSSTTAPRQRSSIPTRGICRPTVSSALKTIPNPSSTASSSTAQKQQNQVSFESPVISNTLAGKSAPLSNIPVRSYAQKASTNAPGKVLDQGRRAVRTLARLIY